AHDREEAGHHGEPGQRDRLATIGDLEVDANGLTKRSGQRGGPLRGAGGNEAGAGEPAESVGVAGLARCRARGDPAVFDAVHIVPPSFGNWRTGCVDWHVTVLAPG